MDLERRQLDAELGQWRGASVELGESRIGVGGGTVNALRSVQYNAEGKPTEGFYGGTFVRIR